MATGYGEKVHITAQLEMGELIYGVLLETYLRGRTVQNDANYKEVASMFASEDEENADKILRSITSAVAEIKTEIGEYLEGTEKVSSNDSYGLGDDISITLLMPSNYNQAVTKTIAAGMHDYIVYRSIADWYMVTNKEESADYMAKARVGLENMKKSLSKRSRPKRQTT